MGAGKERGGMAKSPGQPQDNPSLSWSGLVCGGVVDSASLSCEKRGGARQNHWIGRGGVTV